MPNAPVWVEISRPAREWEVKPNIVESMKSGLLGAQGLAQGGLLLAVGSGVGEARGEEWS